jgi:hypothetical protein
MVMQRLSVARLRKRLPFPLFVLVLIFALIAMGFACACASDHPTDLAKRVMAPVPVTEAVIGLWSLVIAAMFLIASTVPRRLAPSDRASPEQLQRFLF